MLLRFWPTRPQGRKTLPMKISFHLDDHADADEVGKLKAFLALLEGGEPTSTVDDEPTPVAPKKNKKVKEEEPTEDANDDAEATEPVEDADEVEELSPAMIAKLKDAGRAILTNEKKGNAALKVVLAKIGVSKISEIKVDKADYALKLLLKAAI